MPGLTGRIIQGRRGKYKIIRKIGQGGMGIVYLAENAANKELVAVKRLPASMSQDEGYVHALEREWHAITNYTHPNIVRPVDAFRLGDEYFLVMEYVDGQTLEAMVAKRGGPLPVKAGVQYILQVARALSYLHQHHFIHRDVSPSNIMVTKDGTVKLTDFGLAHSANEMTDIAERGRFKKFNVTAPELFLNKPSTPAADVYGLAATLFYVLTGRYPFVADTPDVVMYKHINEPPPDPRKFNQHIPRSVAGVILKGLEKNPADRYPTATEFGAALENAVQGQLARKSHGMAHVAGAVLGLFAAVIIMLVLLRMRERPGIHPVPAISATSVQTAVATRRPTPIPVETPTALVTDTPAPIPTRTDTPTSELIDTPTPEERATPAPEPVSKCSYAPLSITNPVDGQEVPRDEPLVVRGTAYVGPERPPFAYYKIEVQAPSGGWIVGYRGDKAHTEESVLGTLDFARHHDLRNLQPGWYHMRLMVVDASGNYPTPCVITIHLVSP